MPPRELSKHMVLYSYDGNTFTSIGVLNDGQLMTNLSEIVNPEEVDDCSLRALMDIHVELKIGLLTRLKLMWILRKNNKEKKKCKFFERIQDSFRTFFQGLKYQIKHRKSRN